MLEPRHIILPPLEIVQLSIRLSLLLLPRLPRSQSLWPGHRKNGTPEAWPSANESYKNNLVFTHLQRTAFSMSKATLVPK